MKKIWMLFISSVIIFWACLPFSWTSPEIDDVFYLADSLGNQATAFKSGDTFYMHFELENTTGDSVAYTKLDSGPFIRFEIYQDGQYIAGSCDGLGFYQPVTQHKLAPGEIVSGEWWAPTTPLQDPIVILSAGEYQAVAVFPQIPELKTDTITAINFTITE